MVKKYVIFIYFMAMLILLAMAVTSCRSVRYVPVETVKHDSVYFNKVVRDSIHVKDSVLVIVKGDTVTEFRYKYIYRDKAKTDTAYVSRTDTLRVPYPVEAKLTKWQQFKMEAGGYAIALAVILVIAVAGYFVMKIVIRFVIPNNPITGLLFGDTGAIRITEEDLKELKEIIICQ